MHKGSLGRYGRGTEPASGWPSERDLFRAAGTAWGCDSQPVSRPQRSDLGGHVAGSSDRSKRTVHNTGQIGSAVQFSEQNLDGEQRKLKAGVSTSYNVLLRERDLLSARLLEVQAQVAYAKARVARDQATGLLLDENHVTLDDALRGQITSSAVPVR